MATLHNWTYTQTTQQPRLFVQELMARHEAEAKYSKEKARQDAKQNSLDGEPADFPE